MEPKGAMISRQALPPQVVMANLNGHIQKYGKYLYILGFIVNTLIDIVIDIVYLYIVRIEIV